MSFDFRAGNTESAAMQLDMIYQIFHDKSIMAVTEKPEQQKILADIAGTVSRMAKEGVRLEICLVATKIMGVDPSSYKKQLATDLHRLTQIY